MTVKVVLSDLDTLRTRLTGAAKDYRGLAKEVAPPVADGGDAGLNQSIAAVAGLITSLHDAFVQRLEDHAGQIGYAHDSFQRGDVDVHGLFEDLMKGDG